MLYAGPVTMAGLFSMTPEHYTKWRHDKHWHKLITHPSKRILVLWPSAQPIWSTQLDIHLQRPKHSISMEADSPK